MRQYGGVTAADHSKELKAGTVLPVWAATVAAAVIIGFASPRDEYFTWLLVTLAAAVIVTFVVQLSTLTKVGFVDRVMASVGGAVLLLGMATGVLALLTALSG